MKIIIIGGVAAGTKAAAKIKRLKPDYEVIIYTSDTHVSYSACGFPYFIEGNFDDENLLYARTVEEFENSGIQINTEHECTKIIPKEKKIIIKNKNKEFEDFYDKLLIATGASPHFPYIKGNTLQNIFTLRKVEDALAIKAACKSAKNALIIGGGYIGIEMLEAFTKLGIKTTLVEAGSEILTILDTDMSENIKEHILAKDKSVNIILSDSIEEFKGESSVKQAVTKTGKVLDADIVLVAAGIKPNIELAKDAGIEIGVTGAIQVNSKMQTNIKDIYAAGDCAEKNHILGKTPVWIPLGSTANKEGRVAALNICGEKECFEGILGSAVTKYFEYTISRTGLSEKEACLYGYNPISEIMTKYDKVGYMPEAKKITIKVTADKKTRRIIGAQAIGCGDADKRINTLTTAILCNATVDDFLNNDITYAPPYSTTIDILLNVCKKLQDKLNNVK